MRIVIWTDERGYKQRALVRDGDNDQDAPSIGVRSNVPDLSQLDWQEIERELHNWLTDRGLVSWSDVQKSQNGIDWVVKTVMSKRIIRLYREVGNG